jgi:hypothetical protein
MKRLILTILVLLVCSRAWAPEYRHFGVHTFEACRAISDAGGNPAAVWAVIAKTKAPVTAWITPITDLWETDQGQLRQLLVYDSKVLNASYQPTVPLLDLQDHYEFLFMSTVRVQKWQRFLWSNLEFFNPIMPEDIYIEGPKNLAVEDMWVPGPMNVLID